MAGRNYDNTEHACGHDVVEAGCNERDVNYTAQLDAKCLTGEPSINDHSPTDVTH